MPSTVLRNGWYARFPSSHVRISFSAVMRREKLIHMGIMKINTITVFPFILPVARTYAKG